jgi:hypothetical protein
VIELAESDTDDEAIMGIAGHVSCAMHYSHVQMKAERLATDGTFESDRIALAEVDSFREQFQTAKGCVRRPSRKALVGVHADFSNFSRGMLSISIRNP